MSIAKNPVLSGFYPDPSICRVGEDYYMVNSSFAYFPGIPVFHSRDLAHWEQIGNALDREEQLPLSGSEISRGIFAPTIRYHEGTYYIITTNVDHGGNFVITAQDPKGPWSVPHYLGDAAEGIDPSLFFDEDGKAYIVNNDDAPDYKPEYSGHRTIRIQEFDVKSDKTIGPRKILVNKGVHPEEKPIWIEGPHMYKINGKYFLMDAEGGTSTWHSEVIFRSDSPMGTFTPWTKNPILTQRHLSAERPNPITCAGHADLIQTKEGDWWAVFLACRPINNKFENLGRETFLMPVRWSEDGFPYMTQGNETVPLILKRTGVKRDASVTFGNFKEIEDFDNASLGMQWITLRAPATELYSLSDTPGFLTLKCADVSAAEKDTPAFVCRRMQHHKFESTTRMLFNPSDEKEKAGVLLFKDEKHQYLFAVNKQGENKSVFLKRIGESEQILASDTISGNTKEIYLKVISQGTHYDFYYSLKGEKDWTLLCKDVDASYLSTTTAGGFTGSVIGLYATCK